MKRRFGLLALAASRQSSKSRSQIWQRTLIVGVQLDNFYKTLYNASR